MYLNVCSFLSLSPFFSSSTHLAHPPISTRFSILHSFPLLPFRSFFSFFFFFFFFFLVLLEEYTSCTCVWFFAELSLSSQAEIHIWFATHCFNACSNFPSLDPSLAYSPIRHSWSDRRRRKKKKRKASRHYYNNERRQNATRILFEDESRISIRLFRRGHPIRSMITKIKIRKIIQVRRELSLSLSFSLSLEARSKIVPFLFFFFSFFFSI